MRSERNSADYQHRRRQRVLCIQALNSAKPLIERYCDYTTHHGIKRLREQSNLIGRLIWAAVIIGAYTGLTFQAFSLIKKFLDLPVSTSVSKNLDYEFPDVYICPVHAISMSSLTPGFERSEMLRMEDPLADDDNLKVTEFFLNEKSIGNDGLIVYSYDLKKDIKALSELVTQSEKSMVETRKRADYHKGSECRFTPAGEEYSGSMATVPIFAPLDTVLPLDSAGNHQPYVTKKACIPWNIAARELKALGVPLADRILALNFADSDNRCKTPTGLLLSSFELYVNKSQLRWQDSEHARNLRGPYCFYRDNLNRLSADHCAVPWCAAPEYPDCVSLDKADLVKNSDRWRQYTGYINVSITGKTCLPWDVAEQLALRDKPAYAAFNKRYYIMGPDFGLEDHTVLGKHNYCRRVSASLQLLQAKSSEFKRIEIGRKQLYQCITKLSKDGHLEFEACALPICNSKFPSISGVIRDGVGSAVLAREFGSGLNVTLIKCKFGGQKCSQRDFLNFYHPQLGVCHLFLKDRFTRRMNGMQVARAKLTILLFTDSADSIGRKLPELNRLERIIRWKNNSIMEETMAFRTMIVPPKAFPTAVGAMEIPPAHHLDVQLRFNKFIQVSTRQNPCNSSTASVSYRMPSWYSNYSEPDTLKLTVLFQGLNWTQKISLLERILRQKYIASNQIMLDMTFDLPDQQHCVYEYQIQKFVESCGCLPSSLLVPSHFFSKYSLCFNSTDLEYLAASDRCYETVVGNLHLLQDDALKVCQPMCQMPSYSFRQRTSYWPRIPRKEAVPFLESLATLKGFRSSINDARGVGSIYHVFLLALNDSSKGYADKDALEIVRFEDKLRSLENRVAKLTVGAWTPYCEQTEENWAYPLQNLMADIGGTLGLWGGISVLTLCEIIELLFYISRAVWWVSTSNPSPVIPRD